MKGLTLLELIIASAISVIAGGLLVLVMYNSTTLFRHQSSKISEGLNLNDALLQIRSVIKQAAAVEDFSGPEKLVLRVASHDFSGNIIDNTFDQFMFYLDGNKLRFKVFPDALSFRKSEDQILSTSVDSMLFMYFNSASPPVEVPPVSAAKIRVSLTLKQQIGSVFEVITDQTEVNLRND